MSHINVRLLGGFEVQVSGQFGAPLSIKKAQALLAYLALHPGQHRPREKLAALLWGETADEFARTNLRQTLAVLRKALIHNQCPCVLSVGTDLYLDATQAKIDVTRFEQCCGQATPVALEEAVVLYQGEFLEGFTLNEEAFEDWLMSERRRLRECQLQALNTLLAHYLDTAQREHVIDTAVKLLMLDPLREAVHRTLMRCYHAQGMRGSLLRQYESCREILRRELDIEPEAETEQLYHQLISQSPAPSAVSNPPAQNLNENKPTAVSPVTQAAVGTESAHAERRQLTVMLVNLVGSTALAERFDPEEPGDTIRAFQECCTKLVNRYEGHIANYMGDGMLVYFGYPRTHEDDAERALHAGLEIIDAVGRPELRSALKLQTRIGVATGLVVVGGTLSGAGDEAQSVVGETPNLAARLQNLAAPNSLVISTHTQLLAGGVFEYKALGSHTLKGFSKPVQAWRVLGSRAVESRFEAHTQKLLTLVGREAELGLLYERWQQAKAGEGQLVLLSGEAGIGKSRIVRALHDVLAVEDHYRINYQCSPYHSDTALYPAIQQLTRAADFTGSDNVNSKLNKLEALLGLTLAEPREGVPLIAALLGIDSEARYGKLDLTPQQQRTRTLQALVAQLAGLAQRQPVLFVLEDAHWIDPTTLELIEISLDAVNQARVLLLITARPTFEHRFGGHPIVTRLALNRLGRGPSIAIIKSLSGGKTLPEELLDEIIHKTDGVPLFVEELTKTVLESGLLREIDDAYVLDEPLRRIDIPSSLHDSLMARLDRLQPIREVAQTAACIGREFSYALLAALVRLDNQKLLAALEQLVEAELMFRRGTPPQAHYTFKHALVRDAAYESLLKSKRQQIHARIARTLEERFAEYAETEPELLAHHYTHAGLTEPAVDYWQRAGQRASRRSAYVETIAHLTQGLTLLLTLPKTPVRHQQELDFQVTLGSALIVTKGYGALEVHRTYTRAQALCQHLGDTPQRFSALRGLLVYWLVRGETERALKLGEQLLALADSGGNLASLMLAHYMIGIVLFHRGEQASCHPLLAEALAIYSPQEHRNLAFSYGIDLGVAAMDYSAWNLWLRGYPDQAMGRMQKALALSQEISHPYSQVHALIYAAALHHFRHEPEAARARSEAAVTLATEQRFTLFRAMATGLFGWSLTASGEGEAGRKQMREGLDTAVTVALLWRHYFLGLFAEGYDEGGDCEVALGALTEGLLVMDETGDRFWGAELHRLQGEMLLTQGAGDTEQAQTCFRQALDLACQQQAKSLELRAATSLARLWRDQDKHQEAYDLLAPVYDWFTEGFDTADLKDAKVLLEELA